MRRPARVGDIDRRAVTAENRDAIVLAVGIAVSTCACGHRAAPEAPLLDASSVAAPAASEPRSGVALDMVANLDACTLGHRGVVLDLGEPSSRARVVGKLEPAPLEIIEREGASWARVRTRSVTLGWYASADDVRDPYPPPSPDGPVYVTVRVRGLAAKSLALYLDGKAFGNAPLAKGEATVLSLKGSALVGEGEHEVLIRFAGAPRGSTDALAEIDWIHLGTEDAGSRYAAPTRRDTVVSASFGGRAMQGLSLRAPGFARCSGWIPAGATVEATVAIAGGGQGDAQIRLLRDRGDPVVLGTEHLTAEDATGKRIAWPVAPGDGHGALAAIELVALTASKGARIVFGEPRVSVTAPPPGASPTPPPARALVLVVLGEISTRSLALYGGTQATPELAALAKAGITFDAERATSGLAGGAFGSMLTGLDARADTLDEPDGRLPKGLTTIAEAAQQAGVATALFTANPTTGAAFGFDRDWGTFAAEPLGGDAPATAVFDHAIDWIDAHKGERFILVIHARGGHPPWDVTPEQLKTLPPEDYNGGLDAKHAAELLSARAACRGRSTGRTQTERAPGRSMRWRSTRTTRPSGGSFRRCARPGATATRR